MCGICGIINFDGKSVSEDSIRKMMQIMKHRGPDDEGVFLQNNVGLGFVRLSIIDLSTAGHQPMFSADGRYVIVFNGEIYNYIEIREELIKKGYIFKSNADTEVLLTSYIEWGESCLDKFNGMWAFVIYDRESEHIFGARDRYGIKPFYYFHNDNCLAFCSEIPPLLSLFNHKPEPDFQSIFDYLVFNRTDQTECTFFKKIKKLQHGNQMIIEDGYMSIKKWYNLKLRAEKTSGFENAEEFRELFSSSIGLHLRSDVPIGVCLSGGLDSSSIVSTLLMDYHMEDLNTFSAIYKKGQAGNETKYILEYTPLIKNMYYTTPDELRLETDLLKFVIAHGEPLPSTAPYAQFKVMELAKQHVTVTLDGQGADEELAGYHYFFGYFFKDLLKHAKFGKLASEISHYIFKHQSLLGIKSFLYFMLPIQLRTQARIKEKGYLNPIFVKKYKESNTISNNLYSSGSLNEALLDHFEYKLEHLLKWEDRNSMWFSLEARVPFLDYRLVEKVMATSSEMIINKGMTKHLLRESMKNILPEKIRSRVDKIGFRTPQDEWFRTPLWKNVIIDILKSKSFKQRNLINTQKALDLYQKHLSGRINISKEIWKWVHLEMWFRIFID